MDKPRVKPLVWEDYPADDGPVMSKAVTLYGTYFIVYDTDDFSGLYLELISHDDARWWQHVRSTCETLMENIHDDDLAPIKAAAQADYEARILAALEPVKVRICQKCGHPENNHPYRHMFVALAEKDT